LDDKTFLLPVPDDDPLFIPPVLGSAATDNHCYALYGNTHVNDISQLVQETNGRPTLIMSRAQLDLQGRAEASANSPVLLIDDNLIAYAAIQPEGVLQTLMRVGMLTFSTNPYDDYNTKPVPQEMFFGRREELNALRNVKSLAVLYGGRRLGKSSLLSQIYQESLGKPGLKSVFMSIDTVASTDNFVLSAWKAIYSSLVHRSIIPEMAPRKSSKWNEIKSYIEKALIDSKLKSLLLLIDEADNLMGRELNRGPKEVGFVQSLDEMTANVSHACNVRTVLAGLHNMTRWADHENSVFGKAEPIDLKPFSTPEDIQRGVRLVTKPLEAMGYQFAPGAEDLPLRILSVCNFYPAFIQLYNKRLVQQLQNNRQYQAPPFLIDANVLDMVEKDSNLMNELRDKFKLNLNLDKRYKAIALILADMYYTEIECGKYNGLTTQEIQEYCEISSGRHFEKTGPGAYEALLDEMCKLTVIERIGNRYLLRSPNIAMMLGDRDRVRILLDELADEIPETQRNPGEKRPRICRHGSNNTSSVTFPMPASWVRNHIDSIDGELLILSGNTRSGIRTIAYKDNSRWDLPIGTYQVVSGANPQGLLNTIKRKRDYLGKNGNAKMMFAMPHGAWRAEQIPEFAGIAQKAGKLGIRVILLACSNRALEIVRSLEEKRLVKDTNGDAKWRVVPIPPWSDDAIYYHIQESRDAENPRMIDAIRIATCGFGEDIVSSCATNLRVQPAERAAKCLIG
jgi:hypothetical protein